MRPDPEILLVHAEGESWQDLAQALRDAQLYVQTASSAADLSLRIRSRPPDVVLLDDRFPGGIDLLLAARQTASGMLIISVHKPRGAEGLYGATLPGATPCPIEPTSPPVLVRMIRDAILTLPPAYLDRPRHQDAAGGPPMRIVVLDDDQIMLSVLCWLLKEQGHHVTACTNPLAAICAISPEIDLVISDVNMPEMDGFEVAELVSASFGNPPPRVLLMSGEDQRARMERTPPCRVIALVEKPISLEHMTRLVQLIGKTRHACPGCVAGLCSLRTAAVKRGDVETQPWSRFCESEAYAQCPFYDDHAGKALRAWAKNPPPLPP